MKMIESEWVRVSDNSSKDGGKSFSTSRSKKAAGKRRRIIKWFLPFVLLENDTYSHSIQPKSTTIDYNDDT